MRRLRGLLRAAPLAIVSLLAVPLACTLPAVPTPTPTLPPITSASTPLTPTPDPTPTPRPRTPSPTQGGSGEDVLPATKNLGPRLPVVIEDRIGTLYVSIDGSVVMQTWPWSNEGCHGPPGPQNYMILSVSAENDEGLLPAGVRFFLWGTIANRDGTVTKPLWQSPQSGFSISGNPQQHRYQNARWLVFQLPQGFRLLARVDDVPPPAELEKIVKDVLQDSTYRRIGVAEETARLVRWLGERYEPGTGVWDLNALGLVVLDPYSAAWGSIRIPITDPFEGVDLDSPCPDLRLIGPPGLGGSAE